LRISVAAIGTGVRPAPGKQQFEATCHYKWRRKRVPQPSAELGGHHSVEDDWNTVTRRDGTLRLRGALNIPAMHEAAEIYRRASDHPLLFEALKRSNPS
jgi:hypothetical protein